jgi:MFS transporter, DHA1 family, multidrug resistance protein
MPKLIPSRQVAWIAMLCPLLIGLSLDIYTPSLPLMQLDLHTTHTLVKFTVACFALSLGLAQIVVGPAADKFGRKRVLLIGLFVYACFAGMTFFVKDITQLLVLRVFQGIFAAAPSVIFKMILSDFYNTEQQRKLSIALAMSVGISPVFGPVMGSYVQHYVGWHYSFVVLACFALVPLVLAWFYLPESYQKDSVQSLKKMACHYAEVLSSWPFLKAALLVVVFNTATDSFGMLSPFVVQHGLHQSVISYGFIALTFGVFLLVGVLANHFFLRWTKARMCVIGSSLMLLSPVLLYVFAWLYGVSVTTFLISMFPMALGLGLLMPNALALAVASFPSRSGFVSASLGVIGIFVAGLVVAGVSIIPLDSVVTYATIFLGFSVFSLLISSLL